MIHPRLRQTSAEPGQSLDVSWFKSKVSGVSVGVSFLHQMFSMRELGKFRRQTHDAAVTRAVPFTCQNEADLPVPVLLPDRSRQVTVVHAAVGTRQVGQEDVVRLAQQLHLSLHPLVRKRRAVGEVPGQKAAESGRRRLSDL